MRRVKLMIVTAVVALVAVTGTTGVAAEAGKAPVMLRSDNWCC